MDIDRCTDGWMDDGRILTIKSLHILSYFILGDKLLKVGLAC
jgi:hypothetical protein